MLEAVVSWGTPATTSGSGSETCPVSFTKECHRKSSSLFLSLGIRLRAVSRSMRVSRRMADKLVATTANAAAHHVVGVLTGGEKQGKWALVRRRGGDRAGFWRSGALCALFSGSGCARL